MITLLPDEQELYAVFRNDTRRRHWLSYRLLIRQLLGRNEIEVHYLPSGKPCIREPQGHISVSHSGAYSAVIFSRTHRVGIDIERIQDRIEKVAHKFLSPEEMQALGDTYRTEKLVTLWAAKEALYKLLGHPGLEFNEDMITDAFEWQGRGSLKAEVKKPGMQGHFGLQYEQVDDYVLVWLTD
jgi:phosphopantetheinyl transferase